MWLKKGQAFSLVRGKISVVVLKKGFNSMPAQAGCRRQSHLLMAVPSEDEGMEIDCYTKNLKKQQQKKSALYERLGSPKFVAAPMVQQSDLAFRLLCRKYGTTLAYTQMLHSSHFSTPSNSFFRETNFDGLDPEETIDRPLIAQFNGNVPETVVKAAKYIEHQVDAIDLNFGCPQQIARKGNYGAFLLENEDLCAALVSALASRPAASTCPPTVKMRCLPGPDGRPDLERTVAFAQRMAAEGAQLLCLHGRTVEQSKTNAGSADWEVIRLVKQEVDIPVIANGGIENFDDVQRCLQITGADAVMSSEALLENPMLFDPARSSAAALATLDGAGWAHRQLGLALEYLELVARHPTHYGTFKSHVFKFLYRLFEEQKDLRAKFGDKSTAMFEDMVVIILEMASRYGYHAAFDRELLENICSNHKSLNYHQKKYRRQISDPYDAVLGSLDSMISRSKENAKRIPPIAPTSWYRRHRGEDTQQQDGGLFGNRTQIEEEVVV